MSLPQERLSNVGRRVWGCHERGQCAVSSDTPSPMRPQSQNVGSTQSRFQEQHGSGVNSLMYVIRLARSILRLEGCSCFRTPPGTRPRSFLDFRMMWLGNGCGSFVMPFRKLKGPPSRYALVCGSISDSTASQEGGTARSARVNVGGNCLPDWPDSGV